MKFSIKDFFSGLITLRFVTLVDSYQYTCQIGREAAVQRCAVNKLVGKFRKIHQKTSAIETIPL